MLCKKMLVVALKGVMFRCQIIRMPALLVSIFTLAMYISMPAPILAQCYPLRPTNDELGYKYRSNRCEGLYESNVSSGGSLQVISLIEGQLNFSLSPNAVLDVVPINDLQTTINIRAVPLSLKTYYRMDASVAGGNDLLWPIGDVIYRIRLTPSQIGVYGWYGAEDDKTFVPLRVSLKGSMHRPGQVTLGLRSSVDINRAVNWRWSIFDSSGCSNYGNWQVATSMYIGGASVVRIPLSNINSNYFCIEARAKEKNTGNWLPPLIVKIRR